MSNKEICQFCDTSIKDKYALKTHLLKNKKCLKIRGLSLDTKFICDGCKHIFPSNINLIVHTEGCKEYVILKVREEYTEKINKLQQEIVDKNKALFDAHNQIDKLQKMLENIAIHAVDKPTMNTTINNIRNSFSDKYFIEDIKRKCQSYLTEQVLVLLDGQRGIAKMCTEYIINTKDKKKLLISTDPSLNKFRYMDKHGNMKDDIDARTFIEKISKPIKEVADIVFDCVISDIKDEQDNIEEDNYTRKAFLHDKEIQANHSLVYIKCFDDPKHNSEFTNELAVLNKNKIS